MRSSVLLFWFLFIWLPVGLNVSSYFVYQFYFLFYELALCVLSHFIYYFFHIALLFHSLQIGFQLSQGFFSRATLAYTACLPFFRTHGDWSIIFVLSHSCNRKPILNRKHFAVSSLSSHAFSSETEVGPLSLGKMFYKVVKFTWKLS